MSSQQEEGQLRDHEIRTQPERQFNAALLQSGHEELLDDDDDDDDVTVKGRPLLSSKEGINDLSICASPADYTQVERASRKRYALNTPSTESTMSLGTALRKFAMEHQLGISINFILLAALTAILFPSLRPRLQSLASIQYRAPSPSHSLWEAKYGVGLQDLGLVASFIVVFTGFRAATLDYVLIPLAGACGIPKKSGKLRFAEQTYLIGYYAFYWSWGVYLFTRDTPASLPIAADGSRESLTARTLLLSIWTQYPRLHLDAPMKIYYLTQLAFWTQQILVIHIEKRRKDHYQMLAHHFVTVALLFTSHFNRQTRAGNAILICMDIIDIIFPTAKVLKYLGWQTACDVMFAIFVFSWLAWRHVAYLAVCWSIWAHPGKETMFFGTYSLEIADPTFNAGTNLARGMKLSNDGGTDIVSNLFQPILRPDQRTVSFNANIKWTFLTLLLGLQAITIAWFFMICRVVVRVLRGEGADDSRSDDEDEAESGDTEQDVASTKSVPFVADSKIRTQLPRYIEVEASPEEIASRRAISRSSSSSKRKSKGLSTGLSLGDHKEILNRIGCLSEEQLARERELKSTEPTRSSSSKR